MVKKFLTGLMICGVSFGLPMTVTFAMDAREQKIKQTFRPGPSPDRIYSAYQPRSSGGKKAEQQRDEADGSTPAARSFARGEKGADPSSNKEVILTVQFHKEVKAEQKKSLHRKQDAQIVDHIFPDIVQVRLNSNRIKGYVQSPLIKRVETDGSLLRDFRQKPTGIRKKDLSEDLAR